MYDREISLVPGDFFLRVCSLAETGGEKRFNLNPMVALLPSAVPSVAFG